MKTNSKNEKILLKNNESSSKNKIKFPDEAGNFAEKIFNTVREPLLLLDSELRVVKASRSFYDFFKVTSNKTIGKLIYDLGNRQWDIPKLRDLLEKILPKKTTFNNYEVEHVFPKIGKRIMLLNARKIQRGELKEQMILLAIEDVTERKHKEELLSESNRLTQEYLDILFNRTHIPIIIWDSLFSITHINHSFEKLCGYTWKEIKNKNLRFLFLQEKAELIIELLKNNLLSEDDEITELDIQTKNKELKTILWNSTNILDKDGIKVVATIAQDITKHKRAEETLMILETRYRRLFETAKDGIIILDADTGMIIDVNPFLIDLLDYSIENFIGKELWELGFFKDIAANKNKFLELQQNKYVRYEDLPLETANGRKLYVEFISNIYLVNNKRVIQCNIRDITERKLAEESKREIEQNYKTLANSGTALIWTAGIDKLCNYFNDVWLEFTGRTLDEEMGNGWVEGVHPNDIERCFDIYTTAFDRRENFSMEYRLKRRDGEYRWILDDGCPRYNSKGEFIGYIGHCLDISERRHFEEENTMLAQSLKSINECVSLTDLNNNIIFVNESFTKTYGYNNSELIGKNIDIVRSPNSSSELKEISLATLQGEWHGEIWNKRKNGSDFPVYLSTTKINDRENKPLWLIGIATDISERKAIERELIEAKEKAEESNKLKTEFLAQMSHEIRTPLNAVQGNVEFLNELFIDNNNDEATESFESIILASKRIIRTIDLILNVSELKTGGYYPNYVNIHLDSEILTCLYQEHQLSAKRKGLELIYKCELTNDIVIADMYSIKQIFSNLIENAIKYTKEGKVEIILGKNKSGNIMIEVKDTGIGISSEFLTKLFEPFLQEEQGYTRSFDGNGLGLLLVKNYCKINNAIIEVESEKNAGSTFRVIFNESIGESSK
ncbi:MAG: PAS domain S-box protein [Melioribacteraceae bacterium]|nr:PAS domain S-box protein [Melioribacteraceae bacterium]